MDFDGLVRTKNALLPRVNQLCDHLNIADKILELKYLEDLTFAPKFWDHPDNAKSVLKKIGCLKDNIALAKRLREYCSDLDVALELAQHDLELLLEAEEIVLRLQSDIENAEITIMLSGELDMNNAIVSIASGAGGTDSCDWADILLRMYLRYCEAKAWKVEILDYQDGDGVGIKGATILVSAPYAYGYLRAESGVHRLVRISPFDAAKRRHTSFAAVYVSPELDEKSTIDIADKDLKVDVFRASGAGGQHVNRTESAVRFTHIPTGIVVSCQNERSQIQNRATALKVLKGRLFELERRNMEERVAEASGEKSEMSWGSQIRSYVLAPYQLVKDHRTNIETSQIQKVLDGQLDMFIRAQLLAVNKRKNI